MKLKYLLVLGILCLLYSDLKAQEWDHWIGRNESELLRQKGLPHAHGYDDGVEYMKYIVVIEDDVTVAEMFYLSAGGQGVDSKITAFMLQVLCDTESERNLSKGYYMGIALIHAGYSFYRKESDGTKIYRKDGIYLHLSDVYIESYYGFEMLFIPDE